MDIIDYKRRWELLANRSRLELDGARGTRQAKWEKVLESINELVAYLELPIALEAQAFEDYRKATKGEKTPPNTCDDPRLNWSRIEKTARENVELFTGDSQRLWIRFHETVVALNSSLKDYGALEKETGKLFRAKILDKAVKTVPKLRLVGN